MNQQPFQLTNDPPPAPKRKADAPDPPERQRLLLDGLDCLPGQLDLFEPPAARRLPPASNEQNTPSQSAFD